MRLTEMWMPEAVHSPKRRRDVPLLYSGKKAAPPLVQDIQLSSKHDASALFGLWADGALCDVTCQAADGVVVAAHKIVLAAASPFFRALFVGAGADMQEGLCNAQSQAVGLPGLPGSSLRLIIEAIYGRTLQVTPDNVQELLAGSGLLQVTAVFNACTEYLVSHIAISNCLEVLELAAAYTASDLQEQALRFIGGNFSEVIRTDGGAAWRALPEECVQAVLGSKELLVPESELDVFHAVTDWVSGDEARRPLLAQLLQQHVLLSVLSPACLQKQVAENAVVASCPEAHAIVASALAEVQKLAALGSARSSLDVTSGVSRRHFATGIMVMGGHDSGWHSLRTSEIYDPQTDTWQAGPMLPASMCPGLSFIGCASVNGSLYTVGGSAFFSPVAIYDHREDSWASCPPLTCPRVNMAVTACAGSLFAIGGRTGPGVGLVLSSVEYYRPGEGAGWQVASSMASGRTSLGATTLAGSLYAVGGQAGRTIFDTIEAMDMETGIWRTVSSPMMQARKYVSVGAVEGRLVVFGGMNSQRARLSTVEAFDPREGVWRALGSMGVARSSAGVASLHGGLYVVGGNGCDDQVHDSMEVYEPTMDAWRFVAPILTPRSGLGVAVI